jgi:hypothetical protein
VFRSAGSAVFWICWSRLVTVGVITIRRKSRLHHIGLGRRLTGTKVTVLIDDLDIRVPNHDTVTTTPSHSE